MNIRQFKDAMSEYSKTNQGYVNVRRNPNDERIAAVHYLALRGVSWVTEMTDVDGTVVTAETPFMKAHFSPTDITQGDLGFGADAPRVVFGCLLESDNEGDEILGRLTRLVGSKPEVC